MSADAHGPGVRLPPPFIYVAFLAAGFALQGAARLPSFASWPAFFIGGAMALVALGIAMLGFRAFRAAETTVRPDKPASSLMTQGIFARTRNPLYLSLLLLFCGIAVFFGALGPLILAPLLVFTMQRLVVTREERYLTGKFGRDYVDYCRRVRRWI